MGGFRKTVMTNKVSNRIQNYLYAVDLFGGVIHWNRHQQGSGVYVFSAHTVLQGLPNSSFFVVIVLRNGMLALHPDPLGMT